MSRESARQSARQSARGFVPPEPHEKYELFDDEIPEGMDAMWLPTKIAGMPNTRVADYYRSGWQPATAEAIPRISGFGVEFPQNMIDLGLLETVRADAPIVVDDQMLVFRPKELSRKAHEQHKRASVDQVANQMARLKQAYRSAGHTPGIRRGHGSLPQAPQSDEE